MAVPAHDERDFEFAKKYNHPIKQSVAPKVIYTGNRTPRNDIEAIERTTTIAFIEYNQKFLLATEQNQYQIFI
jgi:leucyl-tRNA synthetase